MIQTIPRAVLTRYARRAADLYAARDSVRAAFRGPGGWISIAAEALDAEIAAMLNAALNFAVLSAGSRSVH